MIANDSFPVISLTVLGSSKRAGILGERCYFFGEALEGFSGTGKRSSISSTPPSCSHRSLFHLLDQEKIVFALSQTSPCLSSLLLLWQPLPWPHSRHIRLMVTVTVRNVKYDGQNVTSPLPSFLSYCDSVLSRVDRASVTRNQPGLTPLPLYHVNTLTRVHPTFAGPCGLG